MQGHINQIVGALFWMSVDCVLSLTWNNAEDGSSQKQLFYSSVNAYYVRNDK